MSADKQIEVAVQKLAGTYLKDIVSILLCNVDSVDKGLRTCDCTTIGGDASTPLPGVLLCAEVDNGLVVFPTVGSTVIVGLSTRNTAFVLMYSGIDGVQFQDGTFGGMIKLLDPNNSQAGILKKINNLETQVNDILTGLQGITVTIPSGGAVPFAPFFTETPLTPTVRADIENTNITQGK